MDENPAQTSVRARLAEAVGTGEVITVIYHGGSQPGSKREIVPRALSEDRVRAIDVASGGVKAFLLSKLELPGDNASAPTYESAPPAPVRSEPCSLEEGLSEHVDSLTAQGWQIRIGENEADLYLLYRNEKPTQPYLTLRKNTVRVGIGVKISANTDGWEQGRIGFTIATEDMFSSRPWQVIGRERTITYSGFDKALRRFLDSARELAIGPPGVLDELPWEDTPVSKQMRGRLRNLGVEVPPEMTTGQASALIKELKEKSSKPSRDTGKRPAS